MKIVITGASGNVGTGLLRTLAEQHPEYDVVGVCRRPPPSQPPYDGVEWHSVDLGDVTQTRLASLFTGADAVVHLAWRFQPVRRQRDLYRSNIGGTRAVLEAVAKARVPHLVYGSSIGAYAPSRPGTDPVDETWPTSGTPGSVYGEAKADGERLIERFVAEHPDVTVASIRPTLVVQRAAGAAFRALFFDPIVPLTLIRALRAGRVPLLPLPRGVRIQLVHADDVGEALVRILDRRLAGPFNLAADSIDLRGLAAVAHARPWPVSDTVLRLAVSVLWRARLLRLSPGWYDVGTRSPQVDTQRARDLLDWHPAHTTTAAAREQLDGMADTTESLSPALRRDRFRTEPAEPRGRAAELAHSDRVAPKKGN